MKSAASSLGGMNVACVWCPCDMENGAKQTVIDGSEKQVEDTGLTAEISAAVKESL